MDFGSGRLNVFVPFIKEIPDNYAMVTFFLRTTSVLFCFSLSIKGAKMKGNPTANQKTWVLGVRGEGSGGPGKLCPGGKVWDVVEIHPE